MSSTATPTKPQVKRERKSKIERVILPALLDAGAKGLTIKEMVDPVTNKPVEALYIYQAARGEGESLDTPVKPLIEALPEPVRTGSRGRPARRWKLTKATRDRLNKAAKRASA